MPACDTEKHWLKNQKRKVWKRGGERGEKNSNPSSKTIAVIISPLSEMKCFKVMLVDSLDTELESLLNSYSSVKYSKTVDSYLHPE